MDNFEMQKIEEERINLWIRKNEMKKIEEEIMTRIIKRILIALAVAGFVIAILWEPKNKESILMYIFENLPIAYAGFWVGAFFGCFMVSPAKN